MCILFIYIDPNPEKNGYRLIIASNRDEYFKRPAKSAFLCPKSGIIGGRDMEPGREGGMWLGLKAKSDDEKKILKVGALLNITGEKIEHASGRGVLVDDYLEGTLSAEDYVKKLQNEGTNFNGYNLVAVELSKDDANVYLHSNSPVITTNFFGKHIVGVGNSPVNSPLSKVCKGRRKFQNIIEKSNSKEELLEQLLSLMKCDERCIPDEELQSRAPMAYKALSSIFVKIEDQYGTRTHTIILVNYDWEIEFVEQSLEEPIDAANPKWIENVIKSNL